ncbi:hypothetical protein Bbelb_114610, partial [Branchiostoma belcheri]
MRKGPSLPADVTAGPAGDDGLKGSRPNSDRDERPAAGRDRRDARATTQLRREHRRPSSVASEVSQHIHIESRGHTVDLEGVRILDTEQDYFKRGIKEATYIRALQPSLNRDGGRYRLQTTFEPLLTSHKLEKGDLRLFGLEKNTQSSTGHNKTGQTDLKRQMACRQASVSLAQHDRKRPGGRIKTAGRATCSSGCKSDAATRQTESVGFRTEVVLTTRGCHTFAHVFARRQHAEARTAGCDRGFKDDCVCEILAMCCVPAMTSSRLLSCMLRSLMYRPSSSISFVFWMLQKEAQLKHLVRVLDAAKGGEGVALPVGVRSGSDSSHTPRTPAQTPPVGASGPTYGREQRISRACSASAPAGEGVALPVGVRSGSDSSHTPRTPAQTPPVGASGPTYGREQRISRACSASAPAGEGAALPAGVRSGSDSSHTPRTPAQTPPVGASGPTYGRKQRISRACSASAPAGEGVALPVGVRSGSDSSHTPRTPAQTPPVGASGPTYGRKQRISRACSASAPQVKVSRGRSPFWVGLLTHFTDTSSNTTCEGVALPVGVRSGSDSSHTPRTPAQTPPVGASGPTYGRKQRISRACSASGPAGEGVALPVGVRSGSDSSHTPRTPAQTPPVGASGPTYGRKQRISRACSASGPA